MMNKLHIPNGKGLTSSVTSCLEDATEGSTVDNEHGAGDIAAGFARQQERRSGQLFRPSPAAECGCFGKDLFLLIGQDLTWQVCQERTGRKTVHRNVEGTKIQSPRSSHPDPRHLPCPLPPSAPLPTHAHPRRA